MSLETVVEDIRDEARARAEEIREDGERRAEEMVEEAEDDAQQILDEREERIERKTEQEREQALSSAQLEAKQKRLEARRDVLEDVRERVEERLAELEGERREALTRALIENAAAEFDDDAVVELFGRPDDEELIEELLADYDGWSYAGAHDCLGGIVAESDASRLRVNNTFDSVLETVWDDELKEISQRLFEE